MKPLYRSSAAAAFLLSLFGSANLRAAEPTAPPPVPVPRTTSVSGVPVLPGDGIPIEKLVAEPGVITAQATLKSFGGGPSVLSGPGCYGYNDVKFLITAFLRGKCQTPVTMEVLVYYETQVNPVPGKNYVVFFDSNATAEVNGKPVVRCYKILPADAATVAKVKAVIASTPVRPPTPKPEPIPELKPLPESGKS